MLRIEIKEYDQTVFTKLVPEDLAETIMELADEWTAPEADWRERGGAEETDQD